MKALIPSHKENKRYLLLEGDNLKKSVMDAIKDYIGLLGISEASPIWVSKNILSINRKSLEEVRASFVLSRDKINIMKVSGTLNKLKN